LALHEDYRPWPQQPISGEDPIFSEPVPSRPLLAQVLAVNLLLVAGTVLVAALVLDAHSVNILNGQEIPILGAALVATLLGNWLLLHRRFEPLEDLISRMESIDLASSRPQQLALPHADSAEVKRLEGAFGRMVARLETERRSAGRTAIEAQERERRRIAQDLHDEVNQALTAVALRLQASIEHAPEPLRGELEETKELSGQAMRELLSLARQLRPAVLDDHGLVPALRTQVREAAEGSGIECGFTVHGDESRLTPEQQLVVYRVTQESLSNAVQHSGASRIEVELGLRDEVRLRVADDGSGFDAMSARGGLGISGMRERALLIGGQLAIRSRPGGGTTVEMTLA
jgi:two-component system sensor histidine kinase UhpB